MQFYVVICLCFIILDVTGALWRPALALGASRFSIAFFAFCALALSGFTFSPYPEISICAAPLIMGAAFEASAGRSTGGFTYFNAMLALTAGLLCAIGRYAGALGESGLLGGALAGLLCALTAQSRLKSLSAALIAPMIGEVAKSAVDCVWGAYTSFSIGSVYALNSAAAAVAAIFVCLSLFPRTLSEK